MELKEIALGSVANFKYGKMPVKSKITDTGNYPIFSGYRIVGYYDEYNIKENSLIVVARGVGGTGDVKLIPYKCYLTNLSIVVDLQEEIIDKKFLFYYFKLHNLRYLDSGSAQSQITIADLSRAQIRIPSLKEQQKIAKILSALDEKIELNNKINENLHAQAQAIFKSWFVDFEPFGGTMPNDWEKTDIYHYASIIYGAPFASKLFNTEKKGRPLLRIRDLKNQEPSVFTEQMHPKEYLLQQGDIVTGMDGEFKPYLWAGEEVLLNQRVCVFQNKRSLGKVFLYFSIAPQLDLIEKTEMATTVIHIGKSDFEKFEFLLPNEKVLLEFDKLTAPYFELIVKNVKENKKVAQIRDTLLPKLMSGELEV